MSDDADPIKTLATAKDRLIDERRALAIAIALGYRRRRTDDPHTHETRSAFIEVQNLIEAVDRAIAHEKLIPRDRPASLAVPAAETAAATDRFMPQGRQQPPPGAGEFFQLPR